MRNCWSQSYNTINLIPEDSWIYLNILKFLNLIVLVKLYSSRTLVTHFPSYSTSVVCALAQLVPLFCFTNLHYYLLLPHIKTFSRFFRFLFRNGADDATYLELESVCVCMSVHMHEQGKSCWPFLVGGEQQMDHLISSTSLPQKITVVKWGFCVTQVSPVLWSKLFAGSF